MIECAHRNKVRSGSSLASKKNQRSKNQKSKYPKSKIKTQKSKLKNQNSKLKNQNSKIKFYQIKNQKSNKLNKSKIKQQIK